MESTAQHTPGPWSRCYNEHGKIDPKAGTRGHIAGTNGLRVATADVRQDWTEETEANAVLIHAAPDLLKACLGLLALDYYPHGQHNPDEHATEHMQMTPDCEACAAIEAARVAVEKAERKG